MKVDRVFHDCQLPIIAFRGHVCHRFPRRDINKSSLLKLLLHCRAMTEARILTLKFSSNYQLYARCVRMQLYNRIIECYICKNITSELIELMCT